MVLRRRISDLNLNECYWIYTCNPAWKTFQFKWYWDAKKSTVSRSRCPFGSSGICLIVEKINSDSYENNQKDLSKKCEERLGLIWQRSSQNVSAHFHEAAASRNWMNRHMYMRAAAPYLLHASNCKQMKDCRRQPQRLRLSYFSKADIALAIQQKINKKFSISFRFHYLDVGVWSICFYKCTHTRLWMYDQPSSISFPLVSSKHSHTHATIYTHKKNALHGVGTYECIEFTYGDMINTEWERQGATEGNRANRKTRAPVGVWVSAHTTVFAVT